MGGRIKILIPLCRILVPQAPPISALVRHVFEVIGLGADPKVSGVNAGPVVASVHDVHVGRDGAAPVVIGDPVSAPDDARGVGAFSGRPV